MLEFEHLGFKVWWSRMTNIRDWTTQAIKYHCSFFSPMNTEHFWISFSTYHLQDNNQRFRIPVWRDYWCVICTRRDPLDGWTRSSNHAPSFTLITMDTMQYAHPQVENCIMSFWQKLDYNFFMSRITNKWVFHYTCTFSNSVYRNILLPSEKHMRNEVSWYKMNTDLYRTIIL